MRVQLTMLVLAFLIAPAISQSHYIQVGGNYGMAWLNQTGNLPPASQAAGLWSWGTIPKGHSLVGGKLKTDVGGVLIYPAFPANDTPIVLNAMTPGQGINASNLSTLGDPNLYEDPWTVAQTSDRPVLFRVSPY